MSTEHSDPQRPLPSSKLPKAFRYVRLADELEGKIKAGVYRVGEKLPSIRKLRARTGLSISTVYQTYVELEKRGLVEARIKSGYFVKTRRDHLMAAPRARPSRVAPTRVAINDLTRTILANLNDPGTVQFGGGAPAPELLPHRQLLATLRGNGGRHLEAALTQYLPVEGLPALRRQIGQRMLGCSQKSVQEEITITNGCMEAVGLCLRAVAKAGDTVIVESPTFHCLLQLIEDLGMYALELPTDPERGIAAADLQKAISRHRVAACIFISNFQNPLGFALTPEEKQALVQLLNDAEIPVIEDDIYGEMYFGEKRPATLKQFDRKGLVLYCASFSKTLSPGLRVGWTLAGRYTAAVQRLKINTSITTATLNQHMLAEFLKTGAFDRHLRRLRMALKTQVSNTALAIGRHFPQGTRLTAPEGGLLLWVELPEGADSLRIFNAARREGISFLPGVINSADPERYRNCLRISCAQPWSDTHEAALAILGRLIAEEGGRP
jgi:DNA-binding transcriptional MocR family regulator